MISTFSSYFNDQPSTLSFYLAMNFLWISFGILSISFHVQKISAKRYDAFIDAYDAPLGVLEVMHTVKPKGTPEVEGTPEVKGTPQAEGTPQEVRIPVLYTATPRFIGRRDLAAYFDNDDPKIGLVSTFKTACPSYTEEQKLIEAKWRGEEKDAKDGTLFFLVENTGKEMLCQMEPDERPVPSIHEMKEECANRQGEKYEVGYTVYLQDGDVYDYHFIAMYEICHSTVPEIKGTIYTTHSIDSTGLMLLKVHEWYIPDLEKSHKSSLDLEVHALNANLPIYQLVPRYDMPTLLWENTTKFPFNYVSITSGTIFLRMMKFDNVIRLFSKRTKKKLRIFTGTYQTTITETIGSGRLATRHLVPIHSVWKVIFDYAGNATILVTQYTRKACGIITPYICDSGDKDFIVLENYKRGGCIYKCPVTPELLESLHLPKWNINGNLDISYLKKPPRMAAGAEPDADAQSSSSSVSISDFADGASFAVALMVADSGLANAMIDAGVMDSNDGNGAEGGHHDGNNDGDAGTGTADGQGGGE